MLYYLGSTVHLGKKVPKCGNKHTREISFFTLFFQSSLYLIFQSIFKIEESRSTIRLLKDGSRNHLNKKMRVSLFYLSLNTILQAWCLFTMLSAQRVIP